MNEQQHTLSSYDKQLTELTDSVLRMGRNVKEMVDFAWEALTGRQEQTTELAIRADKDINRLDQEIEQQAAVIFALQNPMAVDLRFVMSTLKITSALERAADLAKNTAKRSLKMGDYMPQETLETLKQMVALITSMLEDAVTAVTTRNEEKALSVWKRDDDADDFYHQVVSQMQQVMQTNPDQIANCMHYIHVAKNFERIADHATSIARTVHYITSGQPATKKVLKAANKDNVNV